MVVSTSYGSNGTDTDYGSIQAQRCAADGSAGTDIDGYSVQARRYCGLFCDGFESGDTTGWSASVP